MNTNLQKLLEKKMTRSNFLRASFLLVVSSFAIYGVIDKLLSDAATPYGSGETEGGTLGAGANIINDPTASGGQAVQFGGGPPAPTITLSGSVVSFKTPSATPAVAGFDVYVGGTKTLYSNYAAGLPTSIDLSVAPSTTVWGGTLPIPATGSSEVVTVSAYNSIGEGPQSNSVTYTASASTPPPPVSSSVLVGWATNPGSSCPIPYSLIVDFAESNGTIYSQTQAAKTVGKQLLLFLGACTEAQATAIAQEVLAVGITTPWIRIMGEGGSLAADDGGNTWNEVGMTPAQFITAFQTVAKAFRAVIPGTKVIYNPQLGSVTSPSDQGNGWTNLMSGFPGVYNAETNPGGVDMGSWDGYDYGGAVASYQAQAESCIAFYQSKGIQWGIAEWGLCVGGSGNGGDDAAYINMIAGLCTTANGCAFQSYYSVPAPEGPGGSSTVLSSATPNALAAYIAAFSK